MRGMALLATAFCLAAAVSVGGPVRGAPMPAGTAVPGGAITTNTTWTLAGSPYHIQGNLTVSLIWGNYTMGLTIGDFVIEPGVQVLFDGNYSIRLYAGRIFANGTASAPIVFAPAVDSGRPVQWGELDLTAGRFVHVVAGAGVFISVGSYTGPQSLDNSTVESTYWGLASYSTVVTVTRCTFRKVVGAALDLQGSDDSRFANVTVDGAGVAISLDHIGHPDTGADPIRNVFDHLTVANVSLGVRVNEGFYTPPATNLLINSSFSNVSTVFPVPFSGKVYRNNFVDTGTDFGFTSGGVGLYDNGSVGNYWSHYNGTDADHDGIGDTPYGPDRYPLMSPVGTAGSGSAPSPPSGPSGATAAMGIGPEAFILLAVAAGAVWIVVLALVVGRRRTR